MRGEDPKGDRQEVSLPGSPPYAWGRRRLRNSGARVPRFTPICVGKTTDSCNRRTRSLGSPPYAWGRLEVTVPDDPCVSVHPHMRGEDFALPLLAFPICGSPPYAWGRHSRAGPQRLSRAVHPHMRGEDVFAIISSMAIVGSPPYAWGRRLRPPRSATPDGSPPYAWGRPMLCCLSGPLVPVHPHMRGEDAFV